MLQQVLDMLRGTDVAGRQDAQWQAANDSLSLAVEMLTGDEPDYQAAIATALVGLLALELSRS